MTVEALPANQPETFYRGADRIAEFRNVPTLPDRPEDWVGSVTSRFGLAPSGLSTLVDGRVLGEAIAADPRWWLGPERADTGVLVKLLDAGQRLPLHAHPDRRFATAHLASPYGKTEDLGDPHRTARRVRPPGFRPRRGGRRAGRLGGRAED